MDFSQFINYSVVAFGTTTVYVARLGRTSEHLNSLDRVVGVP